MMKVNRYVISVMNLEMRDRMYGLEQCVLNTPETNALSGVDRD